MTFQKIKAGADKSVSGVPVDGGFYRESWMAKRYCQLQQNSGGLSANFEALSLRVLLWWQFHANALSYGDTRERGEATGIGTRNPQLGRLLTFLTEYGRRLRNKHRSQSHSEYLLKGAG